MKLAPTLASALLAMALAGPACAVAAPTRSTPSASTSSASSVEAATRGLQHVPGFFDLWRDPAKGRLILGIHEFDQPFLLMTSLPWALGSNDIGLDRLFVNLVFSRCLTKI